jgi:hypothetical protein
MRDRLLQPIGKQANLPGVRDLNAEISYELNTQVLPLMNLRFGPRPDRAGKAEKRLKAEFPMRSSVNHPPHPDGP